jgi:hypothetical protein
VGEFLHELKGMKERERETSFYELKWDEGEKGLG